MYVDKWIKFNLQEAFRGEPIDSALDFALFSIFGGGWKKKEMFTDPKLEG